ncbi:MAG: dihydroneopterin aldolase [Actinobacteria bacterium]|nr:dihydroneopterin aldolase [Actinomycetota bacterium]
MSDKITIKGIKALGKHGVLEHEKLVEQEFVVDVTLGIDLDKAIKRDELKETVNYDEVAKLIHKVITGPTFNLIEALAGKIVNEILEKFDLVEKVKVTVHKPKAPISVPFTDVSVTIKRER